MAPTLDGEIIYIQEVRAGIMAMSERPSTIYVDNQAALSNLRRGKLLAKVINELKNVHLLYLSLNIYNL